MPPGDACGIIESQNCLAAVLGLIDHAANPQRIHDLDAGDRMAVVQILAQEFIGIDFLGRCHDERIPEGNLRKIRDFCSTCDGFDRRGVAYPDAICLDDLSCR